jgi:transcriptional regulator
MYTPSYAQTDDSQSVFDFINQHPFAAVIVHTLEQDIEATHLPVVFKGTPNDFYFETHVAKSNPIWKQIEAKPEGLVLFHGPHSYISPRFYVENKNVPTWSYTAVHIKCKIETLHSISEITRILDETTSQYEGNGPGAWKTSDVPASFVEGLKHAIVGLRFFPTQITSKFKLNQNRSAADYESVIKHLEASKNGDHKKLLEWMKRFPKTST